MKPSFYTRYLRWFYDIDTLDEYRLAQIDRLGNRLFTLHFPINLASLLLGYLLMNKAELALDVLMAINFVWFYGSTYYMGWRVHQLGLQSIDQTDYPAIKAKKIKQLRRGLILGLPTYHLLSNYSPSQGWDRVFSVPDLINTLVYGLILYLGLRYFLIKSIKIEPEEP